MGNDTTSDEAISLWKRWVLGTASEGDIVVWARGVLASGRADGEELPAIARLPTDGMFEKKPSVYDYDYYDEALLGPASTLLRTFLLRLRVFGFSEEVVQSFREKVERDLHKQPGEVEVGGGNLVEYVVGMFPDTEPLIAKINLEEFHQFRSPEEVAVRLTRWYFAPLVRSEDVGRLALFADLVEFLLRCGDADVLQAVRMGVIEEIGLNLGDERDRRMREVLYPSLGVLGRDELRSCWSEILEGCS